MGSTRPEDDTVTIHAPENEGPIDKLYVFMSTDENGRHGILADVIPPLGATPLVTGKLSLAEAMKPLAMGIARRSGKRVGMYVFERKAGDPTWSTDQ
jgi:hypothetical protein